MKRLQTLRNLGLSWLRVAALASLATVAAGEALARLQAILQKILDEYNAEHYEQPVN